MERSHTFVLLCCVSVLCACASRPVPPAPVSRASASPAFSGHPDLVRNAAATTDAPSRAAPTRPDPLTPMLYTVAVDRVPIQELLFALARDAELDIDIVGQFEGAVTLNAVDEPLDRILSRIALQVPLRYSVDAGYLRIAADTPFLRIYSVPYLNMGRRSVSRIDLATQIGSTGMSIEGGESSQGNNSRTRIENTSDHLFWETLIRNIGGILGRSTSIDTSAFGGDDFIVVNREAGLLSIRATAGEHDVLGEYISRVVNSARRQVLIEATVVEVQLSEGHQAGVDWSVLSADGEGLSIASGMLGANLATPPGFSLGYLDPASPAGIVDISLRALSSFGDVNVLSSPKIITLSNQTAVLKVVDNRVYFTTSVTVTEASENNPQRETFDTELHTVPIGLVMNVTPFVSDTREIVLNVRPTISRILGFVDDPNPDLAGAGVASRIPEIQVREMESLLRVGTGQTAVIGGLIQERLEVTTSAVPGLSRLPLIGGLFRFRSQQSVKTELLVFLRPTVMEAADFVANEELYREYTAAPDSACPTPRSCR